MTVEHFKQRNAIKRMREAGAVDRLAEYADFLLDTVILLTGAGRQPANYRVVRGRDADDTWLDLEVGTRDLCIGFGKAYEAQGIKTLVVCGDFVLWPDQFYGDQLPSKPSGWPLDTVDYCGLLVPRRRDGTEP